MKRGNGARDEIENAPEMERTCDGMTKGKIGGAAVLTPPALDSAPATATDSELKIANESAELIAYRSLAKTILPESRCVEMVYFRDAEPGYTVTTTYCPDFRYRFQVTGQLTEIQEIAVAMTRPDKIVETKEADDLTLTLDHVKKTYDEFLKSRRARGKKVALFFSIKACSFYEEGLYIAKAQIAFGFAALPNPPRNGKVG